MIIFSLSRPLIIRHPRCAPPSGPSTGTGFMWTRRNPFTFHDDIVPDIAGRSVTPRCPVSRGSSQPSLSSLHRILGDALRWRHNCKLVKVRWSSRMRRWSGITPREGTQLVLGYVVETRLLLGETRKDLCGITLRLSK